MTNDLEIYDRACRAVTEAKNVDEAKHIRDKAVAMRAYARQAKNKDMEADALEIRMRAERRLGELIRAQKETVGLNIGAAGGGSKDGSRGPLLEPRDTRPTLADAGIDKKLSSRAQRLAAVPEKQFEEMVQDGREAVNRVVKIVEAREVRLDRIAEISAGNASLGTTVRYPIIYADPPWQYENPPIGATSRAIENHYPTLSLEEICALPIGQLAHDDAMLYLWATAPKLVECFKVIEAWGFDYRTNLVWDKEIIGMGYHARNQHELLLIARRGSVPPPAAGTQPSSVYRERRGEHSAKPVFFYEMIEAAYPQLAKIELFARNNRKGWDAWGNQVIAA